MTVSGSGFLPGVKAYSFPLGTGIAVSGAQFESANTLTLTLTLANNAADGLTGLTIINPQTTPVENDGLFTVQAMQVSQPPNITSVTPSTVSRNSTATLTIQGSNFQTGAAVTFQKSQGISVQSVTFVSATKLTVAISVARTAETGNRTITVTNPDNKSDALNNALRIQ